MTTEPQVADRGVDFDVARLDAYLKDWFGGTDPTRVGRTHGGMSNPTYFITRGEWRAVLRKQPGNVLMPSAQAIDREYRVLTALQWTSVPPRSRIVTARITKSSARPSQPLPAQPTPFSTLLRPPPPPPHL